MCSRCAKPNGISPGYFELKYKIVDKTEREKCHYQNNQKENETA